MTEGAEFVRAQAELAATQARLELISGQRDELRAQLARVTDQLQQAQQELRAQATELGRLQAEREGLQRERDELRRQLAEREREAAERAAPPGAEEPQEAIKRLRAEYEAAETQWARERERLQARIRELEERPAPQRRELRLTPTELASRFATVLQELAEGPPTPPEQPFSAALTGLEVDAKGVLQAPAEPDQEPTFVTAADGIDPAQLSTMHMTFRLLPRVGGAPPPSSGERPDRG